MTRKTLTAEERKARREAKMADEKARKRWRLVYQMKTGICRGNPRDWRSWRRFFHVPILFKSEEEAWAYFNAVQFKNFPVRRGVSASVESLWLE